MMWQYGGWGGGWESILWFGLHGVGMLLFWGLIVLAVVALVRATVRGSDGGAGNGRREDTALAVVRERYASGDLTREQFQSLRETLRQA